MAAIRERARPTDKCAQRPSSFRHQKKVLSEKGCATSVRASLASQRARFSFCVAELQAAPAAPLSEGATTQVAPGAQRLWDPTQPRPRAEPASWLSSLHAPAYLTILAAAMPSPLVLVATCKSRFGWLWSHSTWRPGFPPPRGQAARSFRGQSVRVFEFARRETWKSAKCQMGQLPTRGPS